MRNLQSLSRFNTREDKEIGFCVEKNGKSPPPTRITRGNRESIQPFEYSSLYLNSVADRQLLEFRQLMGSLSTMLFMHPKPAGECNHLRHLDLG